MIQCPEQEVAWSVTARHRKAGWSLRHANNKQSQNSERTASLIASSLLELL